MVAHFVHSEHTYLIRIGNLLKELENVLSSKQFLWIIGTHELSILILPNGEALPSELGLPVIATNIGFLVWLAILDF